MCGLKNRNPITIDYCELQSSNNKEEIRPLLVNRKKNTKKPTLIPIDALDNNNNNNNNNNSLFTINHLQRTNKDDNNTLTTKIHEKL